MPTPSLPVVPTLAYESRASRGTRSAAYLTWGAAALKLAWMTAAYTVVCAVGACTLGPPAAVACLLLGLCGNWAGAAAGFVVAVGGCFQRSEPRATAVLALGLNALVGVVPLALLAHALSRFSCC